jgi:hypothetical protein
MQKERTIETKVADLEENTAALDFGHGTFDRLKPKISPRHVRTKVYVALASNRIPPR